MSVQNKSHKTRVCSRPFSFQKMTPGKMFVENKSSKTKVNTRPLQITRQPQFFLVLCFVLQQSESTLFGAFGAPVPILMHHHSGGDSTALLSVVPLSPPPEIGSFPTSTISRDHSALNRLSNINNCWSGRFQMDLHKFCPALASKTLSSFPFFTGF